VTLPERQPQRGERPQALDHRNTQASRDQPILCNQPPVQNRAWKRGATGQAHRAGQEPVPMDVDQEGEDHRPQDDHGNRKTWISATSSAAPSGVEQREGGLHLAWRPVEAGHQDKHASSSSGSCHWRRKEQAGGETAQFGNCWTEFLKTMEVGQATPSFHPGRGARFGRRMEPQAACNHLRKAQGIGGMACSCKPLGREPFKQVKGQGPSGRGWAYVDRLSQRPRAPRAVGRGCLILKTGSIPRKRKQQEEDAIHRT
jgi:hypothetical protein